MNGTSHSVRARIAHLLGPVILTGWCIASTAAAPATLQSQYEAADRLFRAIAARPWHWESPEDYGEVIAKLDAIVTRTGETEAALSAQYLKLKCYRRQAEYRKARSAFEQYVRMLAKQRGADGAAAAILSEAEQEHKAEQWSEAGTLYEMLARIYPKSPSAPQALYRLAEIAERKGRSDQTVERYDAVTKACAQSDWGKKAAVRIETVYRRRVEDCYFRWQYDEVKAAAAQLVQRFPTADNKALALFYDGLMHASEARYDEALAAYTKAAASFPETRWGGRAGCYEKDLRERLTSLKRKAARQY